MADTLNAPASGRTARTCAQTLTPSWADKPVNSYAPAFRRRLAYVLADKARRRAELRARTLAVVLADHREGGAA